MSNKSTTPEEVTKPIAGVAKLRVIASKKEYLQAHESDMLDVAVEIYNEEAADDGSDLILETKRLTYALDTTPEEIKADLTKILVTYNADAVAAVLNADHEAKQKAADETMEALTDLVIDQNQEKDNNDTEEE